MQSKKALAEKSESEHHKLSIMLTDAGESVNHTRYFRNASDKEAFISELNNLVFNFEAREGGTKDV